MKQQSNEIRSEQEKPEDANEVPVLVSNSSLAEKNEEAQPEQPVSKGLEEQCAYFAAHRASLTPTERAIYQYYIAGKTTKEIMAELNIKENTLKYHNKNIYSKLGVSSRKQLVMIASMLDESE